MTTFLEDQTHPGYWPAFQAALANELRDVNKCLTEEQQLAIEDDGHPCHEMKTVEDAVRNAAFVAARAVSMFREDFA